MGEKVGEGIDSMISLALAATLLTTPTPPRVIVVTATSGYRHESIEAAEAIIAGLPDIAPRFIRTEEELPAVMAQELASARIVMFVNTTGELAWPERARLLDWIRAGGSFIGVHSASDTWHEWPEYIEMLGGEFESHPEETSRSVISIDRKHPATSGIESPYLVFEEFYQFKNFSADRVRLLMTLPDGAPMAWSREYGSGRVFYTALGHRADVWTSAWFRQHLAGAIFWALGNDLGPRRRAVGK